MVTGGRGAVVTCGRDAVVTGSRGVVATGGRGAVVTGGMEAVVTGSRDAVVGMHACGTWQFCLHNDEPCGFVTFLCVSVATHVTARGVRVITMKRRIRFGSVRG